MIKQRSWVSVRRYRQGEKWYCWTKEYILFLKQSLVIASAMYVGLPNISDAMFWKGWKPSVKNILLSTCQYGMHNKLSQRVSIKSKYSILSD